MNPYTLAGTLGLLLLVLGCRDAPVPPPWADADYRLRDGLDLLRSGYDSLRLWEALELARRLRFQTDTAATARAPELRAELYQRLAMLHHEREYFEDSTTYYTFQAQRSMPPDPSPELRARQLFCRAYAKYYEWEWLEMEMLVSLGRKVLEEADLQRTIQYGQLVNLQSYARRKYIGSWLPLERQQEAWLRLEPLTRQGINLLRNLHSPRARHSYETLIHLYLNLPEKAPEIDRVIDTLLRTGRLDNPMFGYADRVRGYVHYRQGNRDSAQHYYRQFLTRDSVYRQYYTEEARTFLSDMAIADGDFAAGFAYLKTDRAAAGCDPTAGEAYREAAQRYSTRQICLYYELALAEAFMVKYRAQGYRKDLDTAFAMSQRILSDYQNSFPSLREAGVLNKLLEVGGGLLNFCLETASLKATLSDDPVYLNTILNGMELGRSLLLLRDSGPDQRGKWVEESRTLSTKLTRLRDGYVAAGYALGMTDLEDFAQADLTYRYASIRRDGSMGEDPEPPPAVAEGPDVPSVQSTLKSGQGMLQFAQTDTLLLGLYIDQDTALVYRTSRSVLDSVDEIVRYLSGDTILSPRRYGTLAYGVFKILMGHLDVPLADLEELLVLPSESLAELPFSALVVSPPGSVIEFSGLDYLLDHHRVRYLSSWRADLLHGTKTVEDREYGSLFAWTHPRLRGYLGDLGDSISAHFEKKGTHQSQKSMSPEQFLSLANKSDILHLSVHARGNPAVFQDNYIFLTDGDSLGSAALAGASLNARLVVLAACSTARGLSRKGEGTFSLRRSLRIAGVRDVVSSLYDINASATAEILDEFYAHLFAGDDVETSLCKAQRSCRQGKLNQRWTGPRSWAGLIVG